MSFKDFKVMETIGKGSFASVYKVLRKSDNKIYALKRVKIAKMSKKEIEDALNEIRFLASIRHKNIVGFLHAFLENNDSELCIIMEYCGCGDLAQKVERYKKKRQYIDENTVWRYLIQGLKALEHLHSKNICHRDLKVANTFLAEDGSIKIGDMNVSKSLKKGQLQTQIGTPYYMSPEIWQNKPYDSSSDVWSLGCMMYEICALRPPFLGDSFPQLKRAIIMGKYAPIPRTYSAPLHAMIGKMLKLNPRDRLPARALLLCPEIVAKLGLDETSTLFDAGKQKIEFGKMLGTIKMHGGLKKLKSVLPKPCYPDTRPNSPTAWTVQEQKKNLAKVKAAAAAADNVAPPLPPPLPPVSERGQEFRVPDSKENNPPVNSNVQHNYKASEMPSASKYPQQQNQNGPPNPPGLSAVDEYFARKANPVAGGAGGAGVKYVESNYRQPQQPPSAQRIGAYSRQPGTNNSNNPQPPQGQPQPPPSYARRPSGPPPPAGAPSRIKYDSNGHRVQPIMRPVR